MKSPFKQMLKMLAVYLEKQKSLFQKKIWPWKKAVSQDSSFSNQQMVPWWRNIVVKIFTETIWKLHIYFVKTWFDKNKICYFRVYFTPLWDDNLLWQLTKEFQRCMMLAQSSSTQKLKMDCTNSWLKTPHPQGRILFLSYISISFYIPVIYSSQNFDWLIWLEDLVKS